ncbi:MAG: DUF6314 family protein [Aeromonas sp.]
MPQARSQCQSLWDCLPLIRSFTLIASQGHGSATDWCGQAEGEVRVSAPASSAGWHFAECGIYQTPHGQRLKMHNSYQWQRTEAGIELAHLRYGAPVVLFTLVARSQYHWCSQAPHVCGQDHYQAELHLTAAGFDLTWRITGPRKNECLRYAYRL